MVALSGCWTKPSCAAAILVSCIAAAADVSSLLRVNFSSCFLITYSFPILRAQPNNNSNPSVSRLVPCGRRSSIQIFITIILYTSWTSCINGCTTAASISIVTLRSSNHAKFSFRCDNIFWWISAINSRKITSSNFFNPSNNDRKRGMGKSWTSSLDFLKKLRRSRMRNKPAFRSCNLPLLDGFTRQFWYPKSRISPYSVKSCIVNSPFADVNRYIESNKYRAWRCWGSATTSWDHNFGMVSGKLKWRPVAQVVFWDSIVENACSQCHSRCGCHQWIESSCFVTFAFVLSQDMGQCVFYRWYCAARSVCGIG